MRTERWAAAAALVLLAACGGTPEPAPSPEPAAPDPCELVSAETVENVVGPALPSPWRGDVADTYTGTCSWRLDVDLLDVDDVVRRPKLRILRVQTAATNDCGGQTGTSVPTPGSKDSVRICRNDGTADVSLEAIDDLGGEDVPPDQAQVELLLSRVAREVGERWAGAKRLEPNPALTQTATPRPVENVCELVTAQTLRALGTSRARDPVVVGNGPTRCRWDGDQSYLWLTVTPHGTGQGHEGAEFAAVAVRQFAYVWQVTPTDGTAFVTAADSVQGRAAAGRYQLDVSLSGPDATPDQAARVLKDAANALPR